MAIHVGIDLGTTNTVAAVMEKNGRVSFVNFDGEDFLPSVYYNDGLNEYVGISARSRGMLKPHYEIRNFKLEMASTRRYRLNGKEFSAKDIAIIILKCVLREVKKSYSDLNEEYYATITVPVGFSPVQRRATEQAALDAGFVNVNTINEPVASIISYGFYEDLLRQENANLTRRYVICDVGGGTTDMAVVAIKRRYYDIECKAYEKELGGNDFDRVMEQYLYQIINSKTYNYLDFNRKSVLDDIRLRDTYGTEMEFLKVKRNLNEKSREAKEQLSVINEAIIQISNLYSDEQYPSGRMFETRITRNEFLSLTSCAVLLDKFKRCVSNLKSEMSKSGIRESDLDGIIVAGGGMNMPVLQDILQNHFLSVPIIEPEISIFQTVALGAALFGEKLESVDSMNQEAFDVTEISHDDSILKISVSEKKTLSVENTGQLAESGLGSYTEIDRQVEDLAKIQQSIEQERVELEREKVAFEKMKADYEQQRLNADKSPKRKNQITYQQPRYVENANSEMVKDTEVMIIDRMPYNISILLHNGELFPIIEKGTPYPPKVIKRKQFTTNRNRQGRIVFEIYAGNGRRPRDRSNVLIAVQEIQITEEQKGYARIGLEFILDEKGHLSLKLQNLDYPEHPAIINDNIQWKI